MKLTNENFKLYVPKEDQNLMECLLIDLMGINQELINNGEQHKQLYFDIELEHTEYSPERTEPCPDYYGMYTIRFENKSYEIVGDYMNIHELDNAILILCNFIETKIL